MIIEGTKQRKKKEKMAEFHGFPIIAVPILAVFTVCDGIPIQNVGSTKIHRKKNLHGPPFLGNLAPWLNSLSKKSL